MNRIVFILLIILTLSCSGEQTQPPTERGFEQEKLDRLAKTNQFNYDRKIEPVDNPVLDFVAFVLRGIGWFLGNIFGYLVIGILVLLLIWLLINNIKINPQVDKPPDELLRTFESDKISDINFDPLLEDAIKAGDFRLAIRYKFLDLLKKLYLARLIEVRESKTNHEYYNELASAYKADYLKILRLFEFVWYGEFPANQLLFDTYATDCKEFINKLTNANG